MTMFSDLGLCDALLRAVDAQGFSAPTPIQAQAIPHLLDGRDITGLAQTGGGKTAAFLLPMLHVFHEEILVPESHAPLAIILTPTRELASQIGEHLHHLARFTQIRHTVITGGIAYRQQIRALERGVHILVATPGRLQDHVRRGNINFDRVRFFVLDEADRMLDMGFVDEVKDISKKLPEDHQTVLFSATMSKPIRALSERLQNNPARIYIEKETAVASTITHQVMHVAQGNKRDLLMHLIDAGQRQATLIFTRTKAGADKLSRVLDRAGHKVDSLHGDKPQFRRQKILKAFKNGKTNILVATDVAARGIDVKNISLVVNFDMPLESENYVHRVGRTGRAGEAGVALSFCSPDEARLLSDIQYMLKQTIEVDADHEWHVEPRRGEAKGKAKKKQFGPRGRRQGGFKGKSSNGGFKGKSRPWKQKRDQQSAANDSGTSPAVTPRTDFSDSQKPRRDESAKSRRFGGKKKFSAGRGTTAGQSRNAGNSHNANQSRNAGQSRDAAQAPKYSKGSKVGQGKGAKRRSNAASGPKTGFKGGGNRPAFRRAS
jgi:ATP-dependent RNA helicase RhlE